MLDPDPKRPDPQRPDPRRPDPESPQHPAAPHSDPRRPAAQPDPHPLLALFLDAVEGRFPPVDGGVTVLPPPADGIECSVAFTGHAVVATALSAREVAALGPDGFGGSLAPDFLRALAGPRGWIDVVDATLVARGTGGPPRLAELTGADDHPRVRHARRVRTNVRVHGDERGLVTLADGLAGRRELSIELHDPAPGASDPGATAPPVDAQGPGHGPGHAPGGDPRRGRGPGGPGGGPGGRPGDGPGLGPGLGHGRALLADALSLVPEGEPVFAAVAPGNARSLRAFLACGFVPLGSEVLLRPHRG